MIMRDLMGGRRLDLHGNQLGGLIPSTVGKLKALQYVGGTPLTWGCTAVATGCRVRTSRVRAQSERSTMLCLSAVLCPRGAREPVGGRERQERAE